MVKLINILKVKVRLAKFYENKNIYEIKIVNIYKIKIIS